MAQVSKYFLPKLPLPLNMGNSDTVSESWLWLGPIFALVTISTMNRQMEVLSFSLSVNLTFK